MAEFSEAPLAFGEIASRYDTWVRQALPTYDELFRTAVEVIPFNQDDRISVADIGSGTGLFSAAVARAFGNATFDLYDASLEMLAVARERFGGEPERFSFVHQNMVDFDETARFDVVLSSLAIHHLEDADKRRLIGQVHSALKPHGAFINVDQVKGDGPFGQVYWDTWLRKVRQAKAPEEDIQRSVERRQALDRDASLADQLLWLREAGFQADCIYKHYFVAVFLALLE